jgi:hypothetical protein
VGIKSYRIHTLFAVGLPVVRPPPPPLHHFPTDAHIGLAPYGSRSEKGGRELGKEFCRFNFGYYKFFRIIKTFKVRENSERKTLETVKFFIYKIHPPPPPSPVFIAGLNGLSLAFLSRYMAPSSLDNVYYLHPCSHRSPHSFSLVLFGIHFFGLIYNFTNT